MTFKKCKATGCELKSHALEFCRKHHARFIRNGTEISKYDMTRHVQRREAPIDLVKDNRPYARGYLAINLINDIKVKARKRKKEWNLTHPESFKLITSPCFYCGFTPSWPENRVGIDRVDSSIGYMPSNCVSCCFTCNSAKGDKSREDFLLWIQKIYLHNFKT